MRNWIVGSLTALVVALGVAFGSPGAASTPAEVSKTTITQAGGMAVTETIVGFAELTPASTLPAFVAGGSGNFYKRKVCYPLFQMTQANLEVTNYDVTAAQSAWARQEYHIDMDPGRSNTGYWYSAYRSYIDGWQMPGTNDYYVRYSSRSSTHTIEGVWFSGPSVRRCSVTL